MLAESLHVVPVSVHVSLILAVESFLEIIGLIYSRERNVVLRGRNRIEPVTVQGLALVRLNLKRLSYVYVKHLCRSYTSLRLDVVLCTILLLPGRI